MKVPNFDNVDLAILAIVLIEVPILAIGIFKGVDHTALLGFGGLGVTGIVGLAKFKPNGSQQGEGNGQQN